MRKEHIILIFLLLLTITSFDMQPYLLAAINSAEGNIPSECNCELKEALKEGDWQKAHESAEQIIATSFNSPEAKDAYLWLGLYHKSQHDFSKSTEYYQRAAELFPNSWASSEAHARTGCNYYKLNNFSKALEYFRKSGSEAQTWQQRKYASTWAKWVHFALAGKEKRLVVNCATKSINYYLNSKGINLDREKLASSLTLEDGLVSLSEILKFLKKEDVKIKAIRCPLDRIKDLQLPFVAVVKPSHLIVIKDIEKNIEEDIDKKIIVYDPVLGDISYYKKELAKVWTDKVLTISCPSGSNWITFVLELASGRKFASLTKKELDNICLGTCYCCPEMPITACDEDSDDCSSCYGEEAGLGGEAGTCPGCPGFFGFPRITVYTSSLALIVRDTPIGYITALGEDVKISLTFNSDLSHSGIFGNSWHSNLETKIRENPDDSVTVTRSGGHDDTFTYSGGQYNPPVGVSNKLVKNPDGTFTLELTKSHRKYHYDTYANGGKILAIEDRNGNTLSYQYDINNNLDFIIDAIGRITDIQTDAAGRIIQVTDPLARVASFTYEGDDLTQVVDMGGNIFTYDYDDNKNITSITEPRGFYTIGYGQFLDEVWVSSITDPGDNTYHYGGECPTYVRDPRGNYTYYYAELEDFWPFYGDTKRVEDDLGNYVEYTYDDNRDKRQIRNKRGDITFYDYDTNHNITSKTDPEGNTWSYTYDTSNNRTLTTNPRGKTTIYEYDSFNNLVSVTEIDPDETILSVISYVYEWNGLLISMTANGNTTNYSYDPKGNLIKITDPQENIMTFGYDAVGRKVSMTTDTSMTTGYDYDDLNRITKITHPDMTYIQYVYNCCNLCQQRDENGKTTNYEYDSLGRLTEVTDAEGNVTTYTYDEVGNLVSVTDAEEHTTTYTYDDLNRPTKITYPLGDSESYTYDEEGKMTTKTDGRGFTTSYTYDKNNRLIRIRQYIKN